MRTTITLDDALFKELKTVALKTKSPFKEVVDRALREGLRTMHAQPALPPYEPPTFAMGEPAPGVNLDKALQLAAALEDEELLHKMALGK